jgi:hypothetical protein
MPFRFGSGSWQNLFEVVKANATAKKPGQTHTFVYIELERELSS